MITADRENENKTSQTPVKKKYGPQFWSSNAHSTKEFKRSHPPEKKISKNIIEAVPTASSTDLLCVKSTEINLTFEKKLALRCLTSLKKELSKIDINLPLHGSFCLEVNGCFNAHDIDGSINLTTNPEKLPLVKNALQKCGFIPKPQIVASDTFLNFVHNDEKIKVEISVKLPGYVKNDNAYLLTDVSMDFEKTQELEENYDFLFSKKDADLLNYWKKRGQFPIKMPEHNGIKQRKIFPRLIKYVDPENNYLTPHFYFQDPNLRLTFEELNHYWKFYFTNLYYDATLHSHWNHHCQTMGKIFENKSYPQSDSITGNFLYYFCLANLSFMRGPKKYKEEFAKNLTGSLVSYFKLHPEETNNFSAHLFGELIKYPAMLPRQLSNAPIMLEHTIYHERRLEQLYSKAHMEAQRDSRLYDQKNMEMEKDLKDPGRHRLAHDLNSQVELYNLAVCYEDGNGVEKNITEAVRLYSLAAAQSYPPAQNNLGMCYENGNGVTKDLQEAVRLYSLAAAQSYPPAQDNLGICYEEGSGVEKRPHRSGALLSFSC